MSKLFNNCPLWVFLQIPLKHLVLGTHCRDRALDRWYDPVWNFHFPNCNVCLPRDWESHLSTKRDGSLCSVTSLLPGNYCAVTYVFICDTDRPDQVPSLGEDSLPFEMHHTQLAQSCLMPTCESILSFKVLESLLWVSLIVKRPCDSTEVLLSLFWFLFCSFW